MIKCECYKCKGEIPKAPLIHLSGNIENGVDYNKYVNFKYRGYIVEIEPIWYVWINHIEYPLVLTESQVLSLTSRDGISKHGIVEKRKVKIYKRCFLFWKSLYSVSDYDIENREDVIDRVKTKVDDTIRRDMLWRS